MSFERAVGIEDGVVVGPAFYSQQTQRVAERLPLDRTTLHPAQHYKPGTQLIVCAAALVKFCPAATNSAYLLIFSVNLLERNDAELVKF